jgi:pyruvate kinase
MKPAGLDLARVALKYRRTKIVATLGPASSAAETLDALIRAGVDLFRLNFSHGSHESHAEAYRRAREAAERAGKPVAILADLCGPKIRVGRFAGGSIDLVADSEVDVTTEPGAQGLPGLIPSEYDALAHDARPGDRILLDDGKLELRVLRTAPPRIRCLVVQGGRLSDRKGMNLPGVAVSAPALTEKDRADAEFAAGLGVDFMALSFVRRPSDVHDLRGFLRAGGWDTPIVSKIEKPEALESIGEILEASDGVMVARGDLGVEMPAEEVPLIQQELIRLCIDSNRPVIVATQMLESMIENSRPTRAEVTDVAAAALAGADAVMLSGETASGKHPVAAVETMNRVLRLIEGWQWKHGQFGQIIDWAGRPEGLVDDALSRATSGLSRDLRVRGVIVPTSSGRTAREVSSERPAAPIVAAVRTPELMRRLALCWGVLPRVQPASAFDDLPELAQRLARELDLARSGDHILLVWDASSGRTGEAPTVTVLKV